MVDIEHKRVTRPTSDQKSEIIVIEEQLESEEENIVNKDIGAENDAMARSNENVQINITTMSKADERLS